jgi:hypothetical protein
MNIFLLLKFGVAIVIAVLGALLWQANPPADWHVFAAIAWVALMILPIILLNPKRPTEQDIELDLILNEVGRRSPRP